MTLPDGWTLRPYTPEVVGFVNTWGSAGQNYDSNGHYMRILAGTGLAAPVIYPPGVTPPGFTRTDKPAPGSANDTAGNGGPGAGPGGAQ